MQMFFFHFCEVNYCVGSNFDVSKSLARQPPGDPITSEKAGSKAVSFHTEAVQVTHVGSARVGRRASSIDWNRD